MTASDDHLARLRDGVHTWNTWRRQQPDVRPILRGQTLEAADLAGIDFSHADLVDANLERANLYGASLTEANLYHARLTGVNLVEATIADITDARSIPQELMAIVPALPSVPIQPLLLGSAEEYAMFGFFRRFPWVLEPFLYDDADSLIAAIPEHVIAPAEAKAREQRPTR